MQFVGFFREMQPNPDEVFKESIFDHLTGGPSYEASNVVRYLESGYPVFDIMEGTRDVLGGKFLVPGGSSLLTDGQYVWRNDLSYYVREYKINLPVEFLNYMRDRNFEIPRKTHNFSRKSEIPLPGSSVSVVHQCNGSQSADLADD